MEETKMEGTSEMNETKVEGTSEMEETKVEGTSRIYPSLSQLNFYGAACLLSFFLSLSILSVTGILYSQWHAFFKTIACLQWE